MNAHQNSLSKAVSKIEAFLERMFQAPFSRIFPSRVEPIEITQKLKRAMDDGAMLRDDGRYIAPNSYDIYLSPQDHQSFLPNQNKLMRDWQEQLIEYARHRQYSLSDTPVLRLHAATTLKQGQVNVKPAEDSDVHMATQALDAQQLAELWKQYPQGIPGAVSGMQPMQQAAPPPIGGYSGSSANMPPVMPEPQIELPPAQLIINLPQGGQRNYRIDKVVVSVGRQLDNDIIVEDKRVGRYHAQVKFDGQQFILYDLGSTNGTLVNKAQITHPHRLRNGDVFTVGSYDFRFERR